MNHHTAANNGVPSTGNGDGGIQKIKFGFPIFIGADVTKRTGMTFLIGWQPMGVPFRVVVPAGTFSRNLIGNIAPLVNVNPMILIGCKAG